MIIVEIVKIPIDRVHFLPKLSNDTPNKIKEIVNKIRNSGVKISSLLRVASVFPKIKPKTKKIKRYPNIL